MIGHYSSFAGFLILFSGKKVRLKYKIYTYSYIDKFFAASLPLFVETHSFFSQVIRFVIVLIVYFLSNVALQFNYDYLDEITLSEKLNDLNYFIRQVLTLKRAKRLNLL